MGFGYGILPYAAHVYIAEITPKNIRGGFAAAGSIMVCGGLAFMFFVGNIFTWRTLAIFGMMPCLVQFLGLFFIPESPRWLIPFTALCIFLMDKSGRRPLLMICPAGTCLGNILVGLAFLFQDLHLPMELSTTLVLSGVMVYSACMSLGMNGIPWVILAEIFPINIRGSAGSFVTFVYWFSSWIVSYSFNFLFEWSSAGIFFVFATICGSTVLFVAKLVPETKGRSLEEIQASMIHL